MLVFVTAQVMAQVPEVETGVLATAVETAPAWMLYFTVTVGCLLGISEALTAIPSIKANGIFQAIFNVLKALAGNK